MITDDDLTQACPHCNRSLIGDRIPDSQLGEWDLTANPPKRRPYHGPPQFYRREILIEISGVYDGGLFFQCPSCDGRWHRWPEGHYLRKRAEYYVSSAL